MNRVFPDLISTVTGSGDGLRMGEPTARGELAPVFLDALRVKIGDEGLVRNKALYIALRVAAEGTKGVLGSRT